MHVEGADEEKGPLVLSTSCFRFKTVGSMQCTFVPVFSVGFSDARIHQLQ